MGSIFRYRSDSYPSKGWLLLIIILTIASVTIFLGIGIPDIGLFTPIYAIKHYGEFNLDPLSGVLFPISYPPFFHPLVDYYYIPQWHLFWGLTVKTLLIILYFYLSRFLTGSTFASLLAVSILFGVAVFHVGDYDMLNLKLPLGFASLEFRETLYMSFRQTSAIFGLLATIFFLKKRYIASAIILGIGAYYHPLNSINFFGNFTMALMIYSIIGKNKLDYFWSMMKLLIPFILIMVPYLIMMKDIFPDIKPMSYLAFADMALKNEPDDFSVLWFVNYFKVIFFLSFILAVLCGLIHLIFLSKKPIVCSNLRETWKQKELVFPLLFMPWVILSLGLIWEAFLIPYLPEFVNDFMTQLSLRRITSISSIIYIIIFSALFANILFALARAIYIEIFGVQNINFIKSFLIRFRLNSIDAAFSLIFSIFLFTYVIFLGNVNIGTFKHFWNPNQVSPDYLVYSISNSKNKIEKSFSYYSSDSNLPSIPYKSFEDACLWIKNNTPAQAAFFHPTYIKTFRMLSERQGFLAEKVDGNMALYNRKFATIFVKRFSDIHKGLTYDELAIKRKNIYEVLRERYLSLSEMNIEKLKTIYPGYNYFLTESNHALNYPILFENQFLRLYKIS
jgi:hypothetical protein